MIDLFEIKHCHPQRAKVRRKNRSIMWQSQFCNFQCSWRWFLWYSCQCSVNGCTCLSPMKIAWSFVCNRSILYNIFLRFRSYLRAEATSKNMKSVKESDIFSLASTVILLVSLQRCWLLCVWSMGSRSFSKIRQKDDTKSFLKHHALTDRHEHLFGLVTFVCVKSSLLWGSMADICQDGTSEYSFAI